MTSVLWPADENIKLHENGLPWPVAVEKQKLVYSAPSYGKPVWLRKRESITKRRNWFVKSCDSVATLEMLEVSTLNYFRVN